MIKAVIHQSELDDRWYAAFKGENNETWFTSEGYESPYNALRSVRDFAAAMRNTPTSNLQVRIINKSGNDVAIKDDDG